VTDEQRLWPSTTSNAGVVRLRGGRIVTPGGIVDGGILTFAGGLIAAIDGPGAPAPTDVDCTGTWIVPGFIDTHIHGTDGADVLDGAEALATVARTLPQYGVTAFCPTSVACSPDALAALLTAVGTAQAAPHAAAARVAGAHLESNFINPAYAGAQPPDCLRLPPGAAAEAEGRFTGHAIVEVIDAHRDAVAIVTLAPELSGGLDLVRQLSAAGHRVSLGHSAASYEEAMAAIAAGARHATHLFNRMSPFSHRAPGLTGAVLTAPEVTCEVIGDGWHVHAAGVRLALAAKGPAGVLAITDATAVAGLPRGATARLGGATIHAGERTAELPDGTMAGSRTTMDAVFRWLVREVGIEVVDAVRLTAGTPAAALGRRQLGHLSAGAAGDCVVLDDRLRVRQTWIAGCLAWNSGHGPAVSPAGRSR
jgi:N-acetylglucosamine-6-phosphate deacetylase